MRYWWICRRWSSFELSTSSIIMTLHYRLIRSLGHSSFSQNSLIFILAKSWVITKSVCKSLEYRSEDVGVVTYWSQQYWHRMNEWAIFVCLGIKKITDLKQYQIIIGFCWTYIRKTMSMHIYKIQTVIDLINQQIFPPL